MNWTVLIETSDRTDNFILYVSAGGKLEMINVLLNGKFVMLILNRHGNTILFLLKFKLMELPSSNIFYPDVFSFQLGPSPTYT